MDTVRRVAKNTGVVIAGKIISGAIALVTVIFLARYLGASNFGTYSFIFAYLGFFVIITDLGISLILIREISRDRAKADSFIGNAIIIKIILSLFALSLACLIISFLHYPFNTKLLIYIASLSFLLSFRSLYGLIFQVNLRMEYPLLVNIVMNLLRLVLFLFLIFLKAPLFWFIIVVLINIFPEFLLIRHLSRRFVRPKFEMNLGIWKYLFKESWPLALTAGFIMIYHRIDQLMLFQMKGAEAVGYYSAAVGLPEALVIFPSAFMTSVFPLMSQYFQTSRQSLVQVYTLSFKYMLMFIIPIAVGTTLLSKSLISLIYGESFLPSAPALSILIWAEVFVFYGLIHYEILISTNKQRVYLLFTSIGAVVNVILNLILIPRYGIVGASIATLISYVLSAGLIIGHLLPDTRRYNVAGCQAMLKPLVASILMGIYVYHIRSHLALAIIGGAIIFILTMFLIRGINQQDIQFAKAIFRKENT
ncbi:MAG: flippase [Candidatus Desulfaltia sp.]|nr:flippase [Candidatus Desulfaltia sp.]